MTHGLAATAADTAAVYRHIIHTVNLSVSVKRFISISIVYLSYMYMQKVLRVFSMVHVGK